MVFISQILLQVRRSHAKPGPHRFWKRRRILSLSGHFYGRKRKCYRFAFPTLKRDLFHSQLNLRWQSHILRTVWNTRLQAACNELETNFESMKKVLQEVGIGLDRKSLQNLAIWEPRTFRGLAMLTKAKTDVQGLNSLDPPPKGVITRGML